MMALCTSGQEITKDSLCADVLEDGVVYKIWTWDHSSGVVKGGFLKREKYYEEDEIHVYNYDFVRSLPIEAKKIIAIYTSFLPFLFNRETDNELAQALGDFPTLAVARESLLTDYNNTVKQARPFSLSIIKRGNTIYAEWKHSYLREVVDEFSMDGKGGITYVPEVLSQIPYNREYFLKNYKFWSYALNGKNIDFRSTYLDAENIESVEISERDQIVYITQKDKESSYLSLKDIDLSVLNSDIRRLKQIRSVFLVDNGREREYSESYIKIENSIIGHMTIEKNEMYNYYLLMIWLK